MAALARSLSRSGSRRCLSSSPNFRKDYVQELYLNSLKAYQPSPKPANAHVGVVKEFRAPSAPKAPETFTSADLAKELELYDKQGVSMAERSPEDGAPKKTGMSKDDYIALLEQPEKDGLYYGPAGIYSYNKAQGISAGGGH